MILICWGEGRGGDGVQSILRTCFNILANSEEGKSLDFSDDFHSSVFAKKLKEVRTIDCIKGVAWDYLFEFYSGNLF